METQIINFMIPETKLIYCCSCNKEIFANKITGEKIYNHREDLYHLIFWECPFCFNFVSSHKKNQEPLGVIPTKEMRQLRNKIHGILDPLWQNGEVKRSKIYSRMSGFMKNEFHTATLSTLEEHQNALRYAELLKNLVLNNQ